eukprot:14677332-Ditylum_brightwellii.AAC.1
MIQHKEDCGKDEEGNPEIINGGVNDDDSGKESGNEEEVDGGKNRKDAGKASLSEAKGKSLTEKVCKGMEEKENKRKEGECLFEASVDHGFEKGILKLKVQHY